MLLSQPNKKQLVSCLEVSPKLEVNMHRFNLDSIKTESDYGEDGEELPADHERRRVTNDPNCMYSSTRSRRSTPSSRQAASISEPIFIGEGNSVMLDDDTLLLDAPTT